MEIRLFKLLETPILMKAINDIWSKNHILSRDEKLVKFMFYTNPNRHLIAGDDELTFAGAWVDGKVIGLLGVMPFEFNDHGKKGLAITLANWIVDPAYRDSGAGLALLNFAQSFKPNIILAMGLSDEAAKLYKLMRWNILQDVPRWIGLNNKEQTIKTVLEDNSQPVRYVNDIQGIEVDHEFRSFKITELDEQKMSTFIEKFNKKVVGIKRDTAFLMWRYLNHPSFTYQVFVCENRSEIQGLMVLRIEMIQGQYKIGRIVELMALNQDSAISLANVLPNLDSEILFYDFYCYSGVSSWGLETIGFKRVFNSENDSYMLPTRFQPVDYFNTNLMAAMYISEKQISRLNHIIDQQWYLTKGDADQDRPN